MRVLLVHPEDSPQNGPWSHQRWDLIVDLGKSSAFSHQRWSKRFGSPVVCAGSFRHGWSDAEEVRSIFAAGRGYLVDGETVDYWDLISIVFVQEALVLLQLRRLAAEIPRAAELWCTRYSWPARVLPILLGKTMHAFGGGGLERAVARANHYTSVFRRLSLSQIKEVVLDKYDPAFRWRSRFSQRQKSSNRQVVLVPSAYENVSRMAAAYAALLPSHSFLLVATRQSARRFVVPSNVEIRDLSAYAKKVSPTAEIRSLDEGWQQLKLRLRSSDVLSLLLQSGTFDPFSGWLRGCVCVRNAWREVLSREPVCGVLCGDDSNPYTRLPVLLGARRNIPTADFHHGAIDGRYLFKELPSDVYLAKTEMERDYLLRLCKLPIERVLFAPPGPAQAPMIEPRKENDGDSVVFFSEPYEVAGMRAEEVYGELLPMLWRLARENGRDLTVKLHPFESLSHRRRIVRDVLTAEAASRVSLVDGPLTKDLMARTWFGITGESTTALDCSQAGICCFLCGWLAMSPFEYVQQYARFGIGELLSAPEQIGEVPRRLAEFHSHSARSQNRPTPDSGVLRQFLTSRHRQPSVAGSVL